MFFSRNSRLFHLSDPISSLLFHFPMQMQCNDVDTALAELSGLQNRNLHYTPGTTTISSSPSFGNPRKFTPQFSCQGSSITSTTSQPQGLQLHPKYISKVKGELNGRFPDSSNPFCSPLFQILNSPRKSELPAFRMRPYFLPERSRTKSESLDLTNTLPELDSGPMNNDSLFALYPLFTTSTTNSASYSTMMSTTLMDTSAASRSPGILMPPCSFDYEAAVIAGGGGGGGADSVRGYSGDGSRRMRLKMLSGMKKSKSLEDVRAEVLNYDGSQLSHEMEFVSSRIQKLKVQEQE